MGRIWNPRAKRETVGEFLEKWCVLEQGRGSRVVNLFDAYECYCRTVRKADLTLGEFNDELEQRGFRVVERYGHPVWDGIGLAIMQDVVVRRMGGPMNA